MKKVRLVVVMLVVCAILTYLPGCLVIHVDKKTYKPTAPEKAVAAQPEEGSADAPGTAIP